MSVPGGSERLDELLARLASPDAHEREVALDELGDWFERRPTSTDEVRRALQGVQGVLERETERPVLESALHAAAIAAAVGLTTLVGWDALAREIARWERDSALLEYVLAILGASGERAHRPVLERFAGHPDPVVREAARVGLEELDDAA